MTKILAIETATEACSAAIVSEGHSIERFEIAPRQHTDLILRMVDELLAEAEISLSRLDAVAFGSGPGSFMGVRLATGVVQGLALGGELPVIPISSLHALAQRAYDALGAGHIVAAWDARMGEIYWGCYACHQGLTVSVLEDQLSPPGTIQLPLGQDWLLAGNAWQIYRQYLPQPLQRESHLLHPSALAVAKLAVYQFELGKTFSPDQVEPQYLRQKVAFRPPE